MSSRKVWIVLLLAVVFVGAMAMDAYAQDAPARKETSFIQFVKWGGWPGYIIILLSVAGIGLTIEHFITIRRETLMPPDLLTQIESLFEEGDYEEAAVLCDARPCLLTHVLRPALERVGTEWERIDKAIGDASEFETTKLLQKIGIIALIANIAPMLGLFGTVLGMIGAFNEIAVSPTTPKPAQLANSIQQALVTTFMGLLVAIPLTGFFFFFKNRVVQLSTEVGTITETLMERFREEA